jgi:hypothetical protein
MGKEKNTKSLAVRDTSITAKAQKGRAGFAGFAGHPEMLDKILFVLLEAKLGYRVKAAAVFYTTASGEHKGAFGGMTVGEQNELISEIPAIIKRMESHSQSYDQIDFAIARLKALFEKPQEPK